MPDFGFDNWIDAQLRNVPLPPDFLSRLGESGPARDPASADAQLDAALRDVAVPGYLESRLKRIARRRSPLFTQMALAASLFLAVSISAAGYLIFVADSNLNFIAQAVLPAADSAPDQAALVPARPIETAIASATRGVRNQRDPDLDEPTDEQLVSNPRSGEHAASADAARLPVPTLAEISAMSTTVKQALDAQLRSRTLGAHGSLERLPHLDVWESSSARGISPPRVPGYDWMFQLKHGEHPFVSPASHKDLLTSQVPLTFRTTSFDLAVQGTPSGRVPAADEIRLEEFLAAQDYLLPARPQSGLALHAAGTALGFGEANVRLLQLSVQSAAAHLRTHAPARLIVLFDLSTRMRLSGQWETARRSLIKLAGQMTPADRMTLIGFADQPRILAADATADQLAGLLAADSLPQPTGAADMSKAIQAAAAAARTFRTPQAQRVVFIGADQDELSEASFAASSRELAGLAKANIPWEIIQLGAAGQARSDADWARLAEEASGQLARTDSEGAVYNALVEQLIGRPLTTARGVSLRVTFNPQAVASYRLLGHEATTLTGAAGEPLTIDLAADQTATGLYELLLKNGGDVVATAELTWTDPVQGREQHATQKIRRAEFAKSFSSAPVWLQQGIVAAKAAEALRGSFYAPSARAMTQVLELAHQADPRLSQQPAFRQLLTILEHAEKSR